MGKGFSEFNLGNGNGFSVMEVLSSCSNIIGRDIPFSVGARRPGDPTFLISDSHKAAKDLGWSPEYSSLESIVSSAWMWHKKMRDSV